MSAIDPAKVMAEHAGHRAPMFGGDGCIVSNDERRERCEPYRLAEALAAEQAKVQRQTVTKVEELDALPEGAIVLGPEQGDVWSHGFGTPLWFGAGCNMPDTSAHLIEWAAPITVIWVPTDTSALDGPQ